MFANFNLHLYAFVAFVTLAIALIATPAGDPIRDRFGMAGVYAVLGGILMFIYTVYLLIGVWVEEHLFGVRKNLESRRRLVKQNAPKTKAERKLEAMDDGALEARIDKNPKDALAVEILCERLKARGDLQGWARETEYHLTLEAANMTVEEKCAIHNRLADAYFLQLGRPDRAKIALRALTTEFPQSYQATLARRRLKEIEKGERQEP